MEGDRSATRVVAWRATGSGSPDRVPPGVGVPRLCAVEVSVLGPVEVRRAGGSVDLGTPKQRALVAALALSRGWSVSVDAIVDLLWGDAPPPGVTATLQSYVSQLRGALEPDRPKRTPATVLVTVAPGYALKLPDHAYDVVRFEQVVDAAHRELQPVGWRGAAPRDERGLAELAEGLDRALGSWRGTPYTELGDADAAVAERARLEELRLVGLEDRAVAGLALGRHATVAAELEHLTGRHPLRERLWALRVVALARAGRQADALDVLRRLREVLDDELGLEPSPELRELQAAVLRQDPALAWTDPATGPRSGGSPGGGAAAVEGGPVRSGPGPGPAEESAAAVAPWPMLGRDDELSALVDRLTAARAGRPTYAVLTGEPGIGKSRLAGELARRAGADGVRVLLGRCSQDDGAPPLWPWKSVLDTLGVPLLEGGDRASGDGGQFRAWERIAEVVRAAARRQPVLLVLDDLHWADSSTLRVLRLLVETTESARLMVLVTWRSHPEPSGALADAAEALARQHALRLPLAGLPAPAAAEVFARVARTGPDGVATGLADRLHERTDGNPFFLVELARLAGVRGDRWAGEELPTAVTEVINRRLERLPEPTVAALRAAAVIGRRFDTATLAPVTGTDEDDLLDVVEPAQAAGLVREDGIDAYSFAHALVRDTLTGGMSASRRARLHARVAAALTGAAGRESEVAWHWQQAGPSYADRAWRACLDAAGLARRLYAYEQAAELLESAQAALPGDPDATAQDRYDVLMLLVDAYRWSARLPELVATVEQAIAVGEELDDPEAVARAAMATTQGVLWRSGPPGTVNETVVTALRASLDRLPGDDGEVRCRTMLALANELYDSVRWDERRALCDAGLAMARRLGDPRLVMDSCQVAFVSLWTASTAVERLALVDEALELGRSVAAAAGRTGGEPGVERSIVVCSCLRAAVLSELGRVDQMWPAIAEARAVAQEQRIAFGEMVLGGLEVPWHAMAGRFDECDRLIDQLELLGRRMAHNNADEAIASSRLALRLWQGRSIEMVPVLEGFDRSPYPFAASIAVYLWRAGEHDRARQVYAERGAPLDHDNDISLLAWAHSAELALHLGEPGLATGAYELLRPYAGANTCAGSSLALGPVDAYLALAAAASGDLPLASSHADDAVALARSWDVPLVVAWLEQTRRRHGF